MANQTPNKNLQPSEASLSDLLNLLKTEIKLEVNCVHVGTIQSFDATTQTAKASINYKKTYLEFDRASGTSDKQIYRDYAPVVDAPVVTLGGGSSALTFPIEQGDECLILFNDRDIDNWFAGSSNSPPATPRLHSYTDAFILVGVRSKANAISDYDTDAAGFRYGGNSVKIYQDKVVIGIGENTSLEINSAGKLKITNSTGEFVSALITALQTATAGGFPLLADLSVLLSFKE